MPGRKTKGVSRAERENAVEGGSKTVGKPGGNPFVATRLFWLDASEAESNFWRDWFI